MDWCVDCGTYRDFDGWECPVCRAREQLESLRKAYEAELSTLPPELRGRYSADIAKPQRTAQPRRPSVSGMPRKAADRVLRQYDRNVQEWELREIRTEYDRVKHAVYRARKGRNDGE